MRSYTSEMGVVGGDGLSISLPLPVRDGSMFRHRASPYILNYLSDNPDIDLSIRQLSCVTPVSERSTREAVDALEANNLLDVEHRGNARRVSINREQLSGSDDPIERIPQTPFRSAVRVAKHYILDELSGVEGIVLYGSVARGDADNQSDIDLWILVDEDVNLLRQRESANRLAQRLAGLQIPPSVSLKEAREGSFGDMWPQIKKMIENDDDEWASATRHSFEFIVESPGSVIGQSPRIDVEKLFGEGIPLYSTDTLHLVKEEVIRKNE